MEVTNGKSNTVEAQPAPTEAYEGKKKNGMFPVPCYRKDLLQLSNDGKLKFVILMLDGAPDESAAWIDYWTTFLPHTAFTIIISSSSSANDRKACEIAAQRSGTKIIELIRWEAGHGISHHSLSQLIEEAGPQDAILTCRPYDSVGRLIKPLERTMLPAIRTWDCTFLAHSLHDDCVRPLSSTIIVDRVWFRPIRLFVYRFIVYFLYTCSCFLPRLQSRPWRRVVLDRDK